MEPRARDGHRSTMVGSNPGSLLVTPRGRAVGGTHSAILARLAGPGGYYNIGNALALIAGLVVQAAAAARAGDQGAVLDAVRAALIGSPGATALTAAIAIFIVAGEMYHRAWARGLPPDRRMNWWGDFLSGVAAVVLTFALAAFGDILLALLSGAMLALGKFGSALMPEDDAVPGRQASARRWRLVVLASRVPALATLALGLASMLGAGAPADMVVMPAVMFVCYLLWARADLLLLAAPPAAPATPRAARFEPLRGASRR